MAGTPVCDLEKNQRQAVLDMYKRFAFENFVLPDHFPTIVAELRNCWVGCRLKRDLADELRKAPLLRRRNLRVIAKYLRFLCDSDMCSRKTSSFLLNSEDVRVDFISMNVELYAIPSLYISCIGIALSCLAILACFFIGGWIVFGWKVARAARVELLVLGSVFVQSVLALLW